jgi:hypothetical protein
MKVRELADRHLIPRALIIRYPTCRDLLSSHDAPMSESERDIWPPQLQWSELPYLFDGQTSRLKRSQNIDQ